MATSMLRPPQSLLPRRAISTPRRAYSCRSRICVATAAPEWTGRQFTLLSTGEDATAKLASILAKELKPGDAYCLKGDEGAGKTTFSRAFLRAATGDAGLPVHPPTPSLYPQEYNAPNGLPILHMDVNHLQRPSDAQCEQIAALFPGAVSLIEWAETLREWGAAPEQRLAIYFRRLPADDGSSEGQVRIVTVVPHTGAWEFRAGYLHATLTQNGAASGLVVLSDEMAASLTAGLPESLLQAAKA